ncbi:MAG: adenine nucleotide alpha hydrolase [Anaerolineaceae bacterium]|nr:MAG: adenine nucleotide alpha hydrolase [Anaerolineaceae bacterium]
MKDKIILSWSGGKDCAMALVKLQQAYRYQVTHLLTTINRETGRTISHDVHIDLIRAQAESIGLPLHIVEMPPAPTNEEYQVALHASINDLRETGCNLVAYGDIALEDVREYRDEHLERIRMKAIYPLWMRDPFGLAREFQEMGFKGLTVCVDLTRLNESFIGRSYDAQFLRDLPPHIDPCGESGEFHTFVYDGPIFKTPVAFEMGDPYQRDNRFVYCELLPPDAPKDDATDDAE